MSNIHEALSRSGEDLPYRGFISGTHETVYTRDVSSGSTASPDTLPEWELAFRFTSGRLCLAFCATVGERWRRNFERLRTSGDLGRWVVAAGLLPAPPEASEKLLTEARELREAVYRSVRAGMEKNSAGEHDRELLNAWARHPDLAPQLGRGGARAIWGGGSPLAACLATVARDAIELLTSADLARVRECQAADCALLFLDRSRPGRRRWCADGACGSRNRSAAYRKRHTDRWHREQLADGANKPG